MTRDNAISIATLFRHNILTLNEARRAVGNAAVTPEIGDLFWWQIMGATVEGEPDEGDE